MQFTICEQMKFSYILQTALADEVLERFFSQTRQRSGGNFYYIDIRDVTAAAKTVTLHILLKNDLIRVGDNEPDCSIYMYSVGDDHMEILHEHTIQSLLDCHENALKHKIVYMSIYDTADEEDISTKYLTELNQGGSHIPTLSTEFFVHSSYLAHSKISLKKQRCLNSFPNSKKS